MRTITLELLRHGPAHNQLLSPLTQYLALCENHSAVTVNLPFEHNQMLFRLRSLSYRMGEEPRQFQVKDTAQTMGDLLAKVPGLTAGMNQPGSPSEGDAVTHLRLVLSASELALLPFELAMTPPGMPGAGQFMLLQPHAPVCITRETRRVAEDFGEWPSNPRVLVVIASPVGYPAVPAGAHLLALRKALEPWVGASDDDDTDKRRSRVAKHLTVLTDASIESIERACAAERYTHVHFLAHGQEMTDGFDTRFGLALHTAGDPQGPADVVSGERLASALRVSRSIHAGKLSRPSVVTLATCNAANGGSVAGVGASVAHALHLAGIPLVIASQFPLSFGGSVRFVEILYSGFLWGEDPRCVLIDLRRCLYAEFPGTHDWAAVTAYSSLPPDFGRCLADVQIRRTMSNINVALSFADEVVRRFSTRASSLRGQVRRAQRADPQSDDQMVRNAALIDAAQTRISQAKSRLSLLLSKYPDESAKIRGYLASTEKREAALNFQLSCLPSLSEPQREDAREAALHALERARDFYWDAYLGNRSGYWAVVQYLSLTVILKAAQRIADEAPTPGQSVESLWRLAEVQSLHDARNGNQSQREWALANLIELYVIAPLISGVAQHSKRADLEARVTANATELLSVAGARSFEVFSTRQQLVRYLEWYGEIASELPKAIHVLADKAVQALPLGEDQGWQMDVDNGFLWHGAKLQGG